MFKSERESLRVDVPVGFLLAEAREITVSVDRPADSPLAIRLRLIPAVMDDPAPTDRRHSPVPHSARPYRTRVNHDEHLEIEYGGGD